MQYRELRLRCHEAAASGNGATGGCTLSTERSGSRVMKRLHLEIERLAGAFKTYIQFHYLCICNIDR